MAAPAYARDRGGLFVGRDLPDVAPAIFDHRAAIAVGLVGGFLERLCACGDRVLVGCVGVVDVEIEECGSRGAWAYAADHDPRVADSHDSRAIGVDFAGRAENAFYE